MPYHHQPGSKALPEIQRYQKYTELLVRKMSFQRLVREVAQDFRSDVCLWATSLRALKEASESFIVGLMEDTNL